MRPPPLPPSDQINKPISRFDNVQIVLNNDNRIFFSTSFAGSSHLTSSKLRPVGFVPDMTSFRLKSLPVRLPASRAVPRAGSVVGLLPM